MNSHINMIISGQYDHQFILFLYFSTFLITSISTSFPQLDSIFHQFIDPAGELKKYCNSSYINTCEYRYRIISLSLAFAILLLILCGLYFFNHTILRNNKHVQISTDYSWYSSLFKYILIIILFCYIYSNLSYSIVSRYTWMVLPTFSGLWLIYQCYAIIDGSSKLHKYFIHDFIIRKTDDVLISQKTVIPSIYGGGGGSGSTAAAVQITPVPMTMNNRIYLHYLCSSQILDSSHNHRMMNELRNESTNNTSSTVTNTTIIASISIWESIKFYVVMLFYCGMLCFSILFMIAIYILSNHYLTQCTVCTQIISNAMLLVNGIAVLTPILSIYNNQGLLVPALFILYSSTMCLQTVMLDPMNATLDGFEHTLISRIQPEKKPYSYFITAIDRLWALLSMLSISTPAHPTTSMSITEGQVLSSNDTNIIVTRMIAMLHSIITCSDTMLILLFIYSSYHLLVSPEPEEIITHGATYLYNEVRNRCRCFSRCISNSKYKDRDITDFDLNHPMIAQSSITPSMIANSPQTLSSSHHISSLGHSHISSLGHSHFINTNHNSMLDNHTNRRNSKTSNIANKSNTISTSMVSTTNVVMSSTMYNIHSNEIVDKNNNNHSTSSSMVRIGSNSNIDTAMVGADFRYRGYNIASESENRNHNLNIDANSIITDTFKTNSNILSYYLKLLFMNGYISMLFTNWGTFDGTPNGVINIYYNKATTHYQFYSHLIHVYTFIGILLMYVIILMHIHIINSYYHQSKERYYSNNYSLITPSINELI